MRNFNKQIFCTTNHTFVIHIVIKRQAVIVEEVLSYASSLSLPVKPHSSSTVVNMISTIHNINCSVHFNSTNFCTSKILFVINVMNMIIFNQRENAPKVTNNSSLTTMVNITTANNMRTNIFFCPTFNLSLTNVITFSLSSVFIFPF